MKKLFSGKSKTQIDKASIEKILLDYRLASSNLAAYVQKIDINKNTLDLTLVLPKGGGKTPEQIHSELAELLTKIGVEELNLNIRTHVQTTNAMGDKPTNQPPRQSQLQPHPRIKHIIVVASGKGGVGKSTTTANLALALKQMGKNVGVLDADIYGPSIPTMLGIAGVQPQVENEQFVPISAFDMPVLSIGNLLDAENTPVAWRGPKATGALMQLFNQTNWPHLDYLLIDMPPGTGDIQLTLAQRIPVTAAVVVTTPQHIALLDAQKGIELFAKVDIPVLGVVENMALHTCSACGHVEAVFGTGGADWLSTNYNVPLLGQLPLAAGIRQQADSGKPSVAAEDEFASYYLAIAQAMVEKTAQFARPQHNKRIF